MLTPSFDTEQNDEFLIITIRCPYIKISNVEFFIAGTEFKFHCNPYFLRLNLPGEIVEDDRTNASYDTNTGNIVVYLPKKNTKEHFEGLGLLTKLLSGKAATKIDSTKQRSNDLTKANYKPLVEVLDPSKSTDGVYACIDNDEEEDFDWSVEQKLPDEEATDKVSLNNMVHYGFANQYCGILAKLQQEMPSIVDVPNDQFEPHERRIARIAHEESSFDPDHYLADYMEDEQIQVILKYQPEWINQLKHLNEQSNDAATKSIEPDETIISFTSEEKFQMKNLPNREFLLDKRMMHSIYLGLVDIVYAFAYNHRINEGESNVEAAWTICKLSATLSWLEEYHESLNEVVYCCIRRSLCYPLYRHWDLAQIILNDTKQLFHLGRHKLLQCLLQVHKILSGSEPYYILNNLYVTDYCVWIQHASPQQLYKLAQALDDVVISKAEIGWELPELETAAKLVSLNI